MVEIRPQLWLGDVQDAHDLRALHRHGVSAVVSVERDIGPACENGLFRVGTALSDADPNAPELYKKILVTLHRLIQEGHTVLVHCTAGCSRSPAIIAGYLMLSRDLDPYQALDIVRARKPVIQPSWDHIEAICGMREELKVALGL